jgi:hypothetical protein
LRDATLLLTFASAMLQFPRAPFAWPAWFLRQFLGDNMPGFEIGFLVATDNKIWKKI